MNTTWSARWASLAIALSLWCSDAVLAAERWVYVQTNLQVDAEVERVITLIQRARKAGYTHLLVTDSKFSRIPTLPERYLKNVERVKVAARETGVSIVPALFSVGYSNDLLSNNPNLAEGLPVKDALFVVKDDIAAHVPDPDTALRTKWSFVDECVSQEGNVFISGPTKVNARFSQSIRLRPWRQYHISVDIQTNGLRGGVPEIKVLAKGQQLTFTNTKVESTQNWKTFHLTFNSLQHEEAQIYFGVWGGHEGEIRWRGALLEETGLVNVLRRPGAPFVVRTDEGRLLVEGDDYHPFADARVGSVPYGGEYEAWHEPATLHTKAMPEGTRLRISYYHPHIIYDGQVCACVSEPATTDLLAHQAADMHRIWKADSYMMQHDEWRVMNYCAACQARNLTPGQIAASNVAFCQDALHREASGSRVFVWSDMFDPFHNAKPGGYYLVNGPLTDSWKGLRRDTVVVNWNSGKASESLRHFSDLGHQQLIAGYYDGPVEKTREWLAKAKGIPGVIGVMYTTWKRNYADLESFAQMLTEEGY